jgi:two-component system chemotaxis sensor kinase CheA|nr:ATP-binding protein [Kofleriaceae bacterium]
MPAHSTLRVKLIAGALTPLVIAGAFQAIYSVASQRGSARDGMVAKAHAIANLLVGNAGPSLATDDPSGVDEGLANAERDPDFGFALAVAADGHVVAYRGPKEQRDARSAAATITTWPSLTEDDDAVIASYPVTSNGKSLGEVQVGLLMSNARTQAAWSTAWSALISFFGVAAAVAVVLALAGRIVRRNREMTNLLDNMDQGFLSMSRDGTLAPERSKKAIELLGAHVEGHKLWEAMALLDADAAAWLELAWGSVLDGVMPLELTLTQLPSRLTANGRTYHIEYKPTLVGDTVGETLIVITDKTAEIARERAEASERDLLRLIERMTRDPSGFAEFVEETDRLVAHIDADTGAAVTDELRRDVHTLKGNSGIYGLTDIATRCHDLEDRILATGDVDLAIKRGIADAWHDLKTKLDMLVGTRDKHTVDVRDEDVAELRAAIARGAKPGALDAMVRTWALERTRARLERFGEHARGLATRLGKGDLEVDIDDRGLRLDRVRFRPFWSALGHVVRNAVDHGIESADERAQAGKPAHGKLTLESRLDGDAVVIEIADDGRGIDWEAVRDKARAANLPHGERADLVAAILSDGLTTRGEATQTSGRGIGLAAVREACRELGGTIDVTSEPGHGSSFCFRFPGAIAAMTTRMPRISERAS